MLSGAASPWSGLLASPARRRTLLALGAAAVLLALTPLAVAAQLACPEGTELVEAQEAIFGVLDGAFRIGMILGVALCSLMVLYGGIVVMTARGSPQRMESGKTAIMNALIGVVIVVLAGTISQVVVSELFAEGQPECVRVPGASGPGSGGGGSSNPAPAPAPSAVPTSSATPSPRPVATATPDVTASPTPDDGSDDPEDPLPDDPPVTPTESDEMQEE